MGDAYRNAPERLRGSPTVREQRRWDNQIEMNLSAGWREARQIAVKMQKCCRNPRNQGRGFDNGQWHVDEDR